MARRRKRIEKETMEAIDNLDSTQVQKPADPMANLAPAAVFDDPEPKNEASGIEVVETFFSAYEGKYDAGVNPRLGIALDPELYVKTPKDSEGNPLVKYYWGSGRPGRPEKNTSRGWVPVRVNENKELDPSGRPIQVGGMTLLAMPIDEYEKRARMKDRRAVESVRSSRSRAARNVAQEASRAGISDIVSVRDKAETVTVTSSKEE